jgi:ATP-dependent Zn protease
MSQERKKQITSTETRVKKKNAVFYNIFFITTPIILVIFFAYYILQDRPTQQQKNNSMRLNALGRLINSENPDIAKLEEFYLKMIGK